MNINNYHNFTTAGLYVLKLARSYAPIKIAYVKIVLLGILSTALEGATLLASIPILLVVNPDILLSEFNSINLLIKNITEYQQHELILAAAFLILAVGIGKYFVEIIKNRLLATLPATVARNLTVFGYGKLMSAQLTYIQQHKVGEISTWINTMPSRISTVVMAFINLTLSAITIISFVLVSIITSPFLTILSLVFLVVMSVFFRHLVLRQAEKGKDLTKTSKSISQVCSETILWMKQIRLFSGENLAFKKIENLSNDLAQHISSISFNNTLPASIINLSRGVFISMILVFGSWYFYDNIQESLGIFIVFFVVVSRLSGPISSINNLRISIAANISALDEYQWYVGELDKFQQANGSKLFPGLQSEIKFNDVSFRYSMDENHEVVLNHLDITFQHNKITAIVGPSGGGKTTITAMIARLYDPNHGEILFDGVDVREFELSSLRRRIGYVSQDVVLFSDTVANNLLYANPHATREDMIKVSKLVGAYDFIMDMPEGFDSFVGDQGGKLSGGQRQRLSIVRSLLQNPEIIILDEATSQLDVETESIIKEAILGLRGYCTIIIVAHRLSTIKSADKIIVVDGGRVVEDGSHDSLVSAKGRYYSLLNMNELDLVDQSENDDRPQ